MKVLPSDTYRVAELGSDGHEIYATTAHVSQLKSWRILRESDDEVNDRDESDDEVNDRDESDNEANDRDESNDEVQLHAQLRQSARKRKLPARLEGYELGRP